MIRPALELSVGSQTYCILSGALCRSFTVSDYTYSDGTLDTSFVTTVGASSTVSATAIQPDGKIIIGGALTTYSGALANRITRLNSDGTIDTGFLASGASSTVSAIAIQPDGKIIIGGAFTSYS